MRKTKKEMLMEVVREPKKSMDSILLFLVLLLVVWGLIFLYSTSAYNGRVKFHVDFPTNHFRTIHPDWSKTYTYGHYCPPSQSFHAGNYPNQVPDAFHLLHTK